MKVTPILEPLRGERVVHVHPTLRPEVEAQWHRRLNFTTGRSLSDMALRTEQEGRAGRLAMRGQMVSPGIVHGLEILLESDTTSVGTSWYYHIAAGYGLASSGEDVVVPVPARVHYRALPVYAPPLVLAGEGDGTTTETTGPGGLLVRRLGPSLGTLIDDGVTLPLAGIVVLQPVVSDIIGDFDPTDPCEIDPSADAFADWQHVDGARLVFYAWPSEWLPLPVPDARWRNRLAYAIFEAERMLAPEHVLPWEDLGVPIGLVGFDSAWQPLFVDRYAVVRAGGKPKRRTPLLPTAGQPFLWQARMQQFAGHVSEHVAAVTTPGFPPAQVAEQFAQQVRYLPPAGLLPLGAIEPRGGQNNFFPSAYRVEAAPVPLEQLDIAMETSASLAPFDTFVPDRVRVLVPVPQPWYEPNLLTIETVSLLFQRAIDAAVERRGVWLQRRLDVRSKHSALVQSIEGEAPVYPTPDPDAHGEIESVETGVLDPAEEDYGTSVALDADGNPITDPQTGEPVLQVDVVEDLRTNLTQQTPLTEAERGELDTRGLEQFIDFLENKVRRAEDKIDFGFLRVQTDIYRIRQFMLGTEAASRLATSPVLASIAKGESALTTREDLNTFLQQIKGAPAEAASITGSGDDVSAGTGSTGSTPQITGVSLTAGTSFLAEETSRVVKRTETSAIERAVDLLGRESSGITRSIEEAAALELIKQATAGGVVSGGKLVADKEDVAQQAPIVGKAYDFRTVTVADRLDEAPANEAKSFTVASKYEVLRDLSELDIALDDVEVPGFYAYSRDPDTNAPAELQMQEVVINLNDSTRTKLVPVETRQTFADLRGGILQEVLQDRHDLDPVNADEAGFFSAGVRALDHTVATLRLVEGRVQGYKRAVALCKTALETLTAVRKQVDQRLLELADGLAEARHDVAVTRALLAEEETRVQGINDRRDAIIAEHVTFLAFYRPRVNALVHDTLPPMRPIDPGLLEDVLPACLARDVTVPQELRAMVDLLRDVPLKWFTHVPQLLHKLDRLEMLHTTMQTAQKRAQAMAFAPVQQAAVSLPGSPLGQAISHAFTAQKKVVMQYRLQTAHMNLTSIAGLSWQRSRTQVEETVSLGDLIDSGHGRSDVAQRGARELEHIAHVATCLYTLFGEVEPRLRLDWATRLSQFDAPVNLRNLTSLPRWGEIDFLQRYEMQSLVDWLYQRVDVRQPDATAMISDLVRVCLLLASHAPVNQLIAGHVQEPTTAKEGDRVKITVPPRKVRIGMHVLMYDAVDTTRVIAQGVVEDLAEGQAAARVVKAQAPIVQLAQGTSVQFGDPVSFGLNPLAGKTLELF